MADLTVTLINVGWGDSILVESTDDNGTVFRGLIDSNDTTTLRSSHLFLKRHFEKAGININDDKPIFDFVMLSHAHADHAQGLKAIMKNFGTEHFWYPKSLEWASFSHLLSYARRSSNVQRQLALNNQTPLPSLGAADMTVLWPLQGDDNIDQQDENNNSIVLQITLGQHSVILTGDAEAEVWQHVAPSIPPDTQFFKVPHHGSVNGSLDNGAPAWLNNCPDVATLGISSHVRPYGHPHQEVIDLFENNSRNYLRTDRHYHIAFTTDGVNQPVLKYFH